MKKILTLIISLVILISITSVSFAMVDTKENIEQFIGIWYRTDEDNSQQMIFVGKNNDLGYYTFKFVIFRDNVVTEYEYSITYDDELNILYLSKAADSVNYKVSIEDSKLKTHSFFTGKDSLYEKISN